MMDDQGSIERFVSLEDDDSSKKKTQWQNAVSELKTSASCASGVANKKKDAANAAELVRLNRACIRRFVNVFFAFYRALHLWEVKEAVPDVAASFDCGIRLHHIVAASDDFSRLSMHWDLMPAAKLNYVHDFSGFFNCISQVVYFVHLFQNHHMITQLFILCTEHSLTSSFQVIYFHNPEYERRPQERKRVVEIAKGRVEEDFDSEKKITALQILPPLLQLYPEVEVAHADEACLAHVSKGRHLWLFAGRTLYLIAPKNEDKDDETNPFSSRMRVLHSRDVAPLLKAYLDSSSSCSSVHLGRESI